MAQTLPESTSNDKFATAIAIRFAPIERKALPKHTGCYNYPSGSLLRSVASSSTLAPSSTRRRRRQSEESTTWLAAEPEPRPIRNTTVLAFTRNVSHMSPTKPDHFVSEFILTTTQCHIYDADAFR
ncbi:hypothetical protein E4U23_001407 [Claviceps purpurea]|nr:hypothetical protein E4U36_003009 [Claviceps purpurea]KAG6256638.1 hypothetical protein E4U23_001407 [Claviceps purpurea]